MAPISYRTYKQDHEGSSLDEIWDEPAWGEGHQHRVGFRNIENRRAGLTHEGDEQPDGNTGKVEKSFENHEHEKTESSPVNLVNFRDIVKNQECFSSIDPADTPVGWRLVLNVTEDWVKKGESWPANEQNHQSSQQHSKQPASTEVNSGANAKEEHDWRRKEEGTKHNDAYAPKDEGKMPKTKYEELYESYTPQETALLQNLRHEKDYITTLTQNDGRRASPMKGRNEHTTSIDEADQFSPDNWIPRSSDLIRITGKHPLNAEPKLSKLFGAGLITPNELHYVRNHGPVPYLTWEKHTIDIEDGKLVLTMDELKHNFDAINIAVALACDGNRRKELNMMKRSKGFGWGSGAVSCSYWKGPLLRDVLLAAGTPEEMFHGKNHEAVRHWVNFEGVDEPSEGKYATCIPLQYAMDPTNDVILAYEMNDEPLPPDHGYPVRLIIPGYVGGRCVKWLGRIWLSDKENTSYYHIWDNRVLPSMVTESDGPFAEALFNHPDTACNEQNLNSVITRPAHGEKISVHEAKRGNTYRISGFAYDGGGHEVQRVEVSLDEGETWLYCLRVFPEAPIRHGNKFWSWLHWHVEVEITHLLKARSIVVRSFNVFKNTQPEVANWNIMGMMNNSWYRVRTEINDGDGEEDSMGTPSILFRHPVEPAAGEGGWMKPSVENKIAQVRQETSTPQKQFTREEVEKHATEDDCWIVVEGKVYDATSVLEWHPGGKAAILVHAGKVHRETTDEFSSVHDDFAYKKLQECALGNLTDKAKGFIRKQAEAAARDAVKSDQDNEKVALQKHRWIPVKLVSRKSASPDTRVYTFSLPEGSPQLGLQTCQHLQLGFHMKDRLLIRSYTPTHPLLPPEYVGDGSVNPTTIQEENATASTHSTRSDQRDGQGTFDLTIKTYFPDSRQPGGAMSNILDVLPLGSFVEARGPTGEIAYHGKSKFTIEGRDLTFTKVNLLLGGSGVTPGFALIARILLSREDPTQIRVLDANKSEGDILLKEEMDHLAKKNPTRIKITHILSHPGQDWAGKKGHVDEDLIKEVFFPPTSFSSRTDEGDVGAQAMNEANGEATAVFLCGPPGMVQKAAMPALRDWGFTEEVDCFGF